MICTTLVLDLGPTLLNYDIVRTCYAAKMKIAVFNRTFQNSALSVLTEAHISFLFTDSISVTWTVCQLAESTITWRSFQKSRYWFYRCEDILK